MKAVEVREQVRLPLRRCVELVLSGVRFRLFRAAITVAIIALAVAFLMTMVSESLIGRRVAEAVRLAAAPRDAMLFWVGRMTNPLTEDRLSEELYALSGRADRQRAKEFMAWGGIDRKELDSLVAIARRRRPFDRFFADQLTEAERRSLFGRRKGADVYAFLQDPERRKTFGAELQRTGKSLPVDPDGPSDPNEGLAAFLADWQAKRRQRSAILAGSAESLRKVRESLKDRPAKQAIADTDTGELARTLTACGFQVTAGQLAPVKEQARLSLDAERIQNVSRSALLKAAMAQRYRMDISKLDYEVLFSKLSSSSGAKWFIEETDATAGMVDPRMSKDRTLRVAQSQLPIDEVRLALKLAEAAEGDDYTEVRTWGGLTDQEMAGLIDVARRQKSYIMFLLDLSKEKRKMLIGSESVDSETFRNLTGESQIDRFRENLSSGDMAKKFPVDGIGAFKQLLSDWERTEPLRHRIRAGREELRQAVADVLAKADQPETLVKDDGQALLAKLIEAGLKLRIPPDRAFVAKKQAAVTLEARKLRALAGVALIRDRLRDRLGGKGSGAEVTPESVLEAASDRGGAGWLRELLNKVSGMRPLKMSPKELRAVSDYWLKDRAISDVETSVAANIGTGEFMGFSGRTLWLLAVSLLVCVVGIANAMLMSVTERFREIATMKCLGATDGFIMTNFVLESCLQGIAGGIIGAVLGLLLGAIRGMAIYGWIAMSSFPLGEVSISAGASLVAGVVISAMAAVYPAWAAARLAPMEAMRIE